MQVAMTDLPQHSDNVDEELRRIQLALDAVFSPTPARPSNQQDASAQWWEQRQLADRYLTSFQTSEVSWMVCDRLLQDSSLVTASANRPQDAVQQQQRRFFAAQTLHTKCRADAFQLPQNSLPSLRDSLLNHLKRYSAIGDTALTNRLAMCISALAVQMSWTTIVSDLLATTQQDRNVSLQVLKILPEECASDRLILVDENVRYHMRDHLVSSSAHVFQFLQSFGGSHEQERIFQVFHTWIQYVPVPAPVLMETTLMEAAVRALVDPQSLEVATDVLVEVLRMYPSHHMANQGLVRKLIPLLSSLPFDQALRSEDEDVLRAYCRIITEMGESYMSLVLSSQQNEASQLVEWILRCSGIGDPEIASITLHFWYRMVLDLEAVEPYEYRQDLVDRYTPHLLKLIDICTVSLMRYPPNFDDLAEDRVDDIIRDRLYLSETVEDCCRLLGGHIVLQQLGNLLRNECQRVDGNVQNEWQGIESCLTSIQSVNRFVPSDEAEILPFCFDMIPRLPTDITPLRFTASKTVGKYASWLAAHPQLLQPLLPFLAHGLSIPICAPAAAVAIKELCQCSNQQMSMGEPVLQLYNDVSAQPGRLDLKDELEVLEGVCRAVSRHIRDTNDTGSTYAQRIVQPIGARLTASVANPNSTAKQHIIPEIERLTVIIRFLSVPGNGASHPIIEIIASSWNLLDGASKRFPQSNDLAEKICRLHKHALRTCGAVAYAPMLDALMEQLVRSYENTRQSPFLYAASVVVAEYGREPQFAPKLFEMISALANTSFTFLRSLDDLTRHPDVVEELFYLMGRMVSHCPGPLVTSPLLPSLFQCAAVGMQLDHRDANKGTLNFLENTIGYGLSLRERNIPESKQALENVLASEGQVIAQNLVLALVGDLPAYNVDTGHGSIAGILWKMNLMSPSIVVRWMTIALAAAPERARSDFLGALDSGLPREDFNLAVRAFKSACERHRKFHKVRR
jgi:transportin-3